MKSHRLILLNQATGLAIVCPLTTTDRGFPFHIPVPVESGLSGFIMVEQVRSVDYRARGASSIGVNQPELLDQVVAIAEACF